MYTLINFTLLVFKLQKLFSHNATVARFLSAKLLSNQFVYHRATYRLTKQFYHGATYLMRNPNYAPEVAKLPICMCFLFPHIAKKIQTFNIWRHKELLTESIFLFILYWYYLLNFYFYFFYFWHLAYKRRNYCSI